MNFSQVMYQDYLNDIIRHYRAGERNGDIPQRLIQPTPGSIKDECLSACEVRFQKKDLRTLTAFFKVGSDQGAILRAIHRCDRDRFRPLVNFLKGATNNTDDLNIELLAWLIDFPQRPFKAEEYAGFPDEMKSTLMLPKMEVESEKFETGIPDTGTHTVEPGLTKDQKRKDRFGKHVLFAIARQRAILVMIGVLLLAFLVVYFVNESISPVILGKETTKTNDSATGNHYKADTPAVSQGKKLPIVKNHTTMPGLSAANFQPGVDFSSFTNPDGNADIALLIVDDNRETATGITSAVANLYRSRSYHVSTGVFTYAFIHSKYMNEVTGGDISILSKLLLPSALKYIVIGKYTSTMDSGRSTRFICRAGLDVTVISVQQKISVDGFGLTVANGYDDEEHARAGAIEKLVDQYQIKSRSIKLN